MAPSRVPAAWRYSTTSRSSPIGMSRARVPSPAPCSDRRVYVPDASTSTASLPESQPARIISGAEKPAAGPPPPISDLALVPLEVQSTRSPSVHIERPWCPRPRLCPNSWPSTPSPCGGAVQVDPGVRAGDGAQTGPGAAGLLRGEDDGQALVVLAHHQALGGQRLPGQRVDPVVVAARGGHRQGDRGAHRSPPRRRAAAESAHVPKPGVRSTLRAWSAQSAAVWRTTASR